MRERYYQSWRHILREGWAFERRVRRPPDNEVNALISFGNSVLYTVCLSEIYRTQLGSAAASSDNGNGAAAHKPTAASAANPVLPRIFLGLGLLSYLLLAPALGKVPTLGAILAALSQFLLVGACILCWQAWRQRQFVKLAGEPLSVLFRRRDAVLSFAEPVFNGHYSRVNCLRNSKRIIRELYLVRGD